MSPTVSGGSPGIGVTPNLKSLDKDNGQAGMLVAVPGTGLTTTAQSANRAYLTRFVPSRSLTIITISFVVSVAASVDDPCDVGIYDSTLATRLGSAGATSGKLNSTGGKVLTLTAPVNLTAGTIYYAAFAYGTLGGTVASVVCANLTAGGTAQLFGTTPPTVDALQKDAAYPLPTSIASPATAGAAVLMALRET